MGGCCCCCASEGLELNSAPPFYHYQTVSEERQPLSHQGTVPTLSTGCLVNTNLETSIPDTYISPPTPIPYDVNLVHPRLQSANQETRGTKNEAAVQAANNVHVGETHTGSTDVVDLKESDCKVQTNIELTVSKELEVEKSDELKKSSEHLDSALEEEEDVCPTCLEEYDAENPKIITKCEHHFHLSCILEWMERSDTCPVCDKEMIFSSLVDTQLSAC